MKPCRIQWVRCLGSTHLKLIFYFPYCSFSQHEHLMPWLSHLIFTISRFHRDAVSCTRSSKDWRGGPVTATERIFLSTVYRIFITLSRVISYHRCTCMPPPSQHLFFRPVLVESSNPHSRYGVADCTLEAHPVYTMAIEPSLDR